jgi:hypothetical protein
MLGNQRIDLTGESARVSLIYNILPDFSMADTVGFDFGRRGRKKAKKLLMNLAIRF